VLKERGCFERLDSDTGFFCCGARYHWGKSSSVAEEVCAGG